MRMTPCQVELTLASLGRDLPMSGSCAGGMGPARETNASQHPPDDVLVRLGGLPAVRADRTATARALLIADALPSADVLAEMLVGRLVCDRLR